MITKYITATTFFIAHLTSLSMTTNSQEHRAGADYTVKEIRTAANNRQSFDQGLTAEWLLTQWMVKNGLGSEQAKDYFVAAMEERLQCEAPVWFQNRLTSFFGDEIGTRKLPSSEQLSAQTVAEIFSKSSIPDPKSEFYFGAKSSRHAIILGTDRCCIRSNLYIIGLEDGTKPTKSVTKDLSLPTDVWSPIFRGREKFSLEGVDVMDCREPAITIVDRVDGRIVVIGDIASRFFISVFSPATKTCELSFVSVWEEEAACLGCTLHQALNVTIAE